AAAQAADVHDGHAGGVVRGIEDVGGHRAGGLAGDVVALAGDAHVVHRDVRTAHAHHGVGAGDRDVAAHVRAAMAAVGDDMEGAHPGVAAAHEMPDHPGLVAVAEVEMACGGGHGDGARHPDVVRHSIVGP